MALDGAVLSCLRRELAAELQQARIDKIYQPQRDELVLLMRTLSGNKRLYIAVGVSGPRLHFTENTSENPAQPPMFCMLLRKRLTGGRLADIRQDGLERALYLDVDCISELGDPIRLTLAVELMGRHSNVILLQPDGIIVDAIKRVHPDTSSVRPVVPGLRYEAPPMPAGRMDFSRHSPSAIVAAVKAAPSAPLSKVLLSVSQGLSPTSCREVAVRATDGRDPTTDEMTASEWLALETAVVHVCKMVEAGGTPYLLTTPDGDMMEYGFMPLTQYGLAARGREMPSFSVLLDVFYAQRTAQERLRVGSQDLRRVLHSATERVTRKVANQRRELAEAADRDVWRLYGDLIHANMHAIPPGVDHADVVNYYDEDCRMLTVPLDPALSAAANARKYYKEYRKAQTAEVMLTDLVAAGEEELRYLDSVTDALSRAQTVRELGALREELEAEGYLRRQKVPKTKQTPPLRPLTFRSDDGFSILVGRNNIENDRLTLRVAKGSDVWLHTKDIAGSHVIVVCEGKTPPDRTLEQAAVLAATHSKAAAGSQVPVDYTLAKFVKKPSGAKAGRVIYTDNRTAYVTPDKLLADRLRAEE